MFVILKAKEIKSQNVNIIKSINKFFMAFRSKVTKTKNS